MPTHDELPRWLGAANSVVKALQRFGLSIGTMHVLSVPGRLSGAMRSTPVSLLTVDGQRYIVAGLDNADWVRNARAAGQGILRHGRWQDHVALIELPIADRAPILRAFPVLVPGGVLFFQKLYGVAAEPDAFAGLADRCPVFRVESRYAEEPLPAANA